MEAISNGVDDYLIDGLSFKLPPGSSYITDRRKVTYWAAGSNIYKPLSGTKVCRFLINGDDGNWLDPSSVRVQFTLQNNSSAGKYLRPLGNPHLFFRRVRILVQNQLAEDILDYNRCHEVFFTEASMPGIASGSSQTVGFKLLSGLFGGQPKLLPIKFAPIVIELEVLNSDTDPIITPGKETSRWID